MHIKEFEQIALSFFSEETLNFFNDGIQFGYNNYHEKDILKIGFSINLTPDIIEEAKEKQVDLILTHHNIWEDHLEMREECIRLLETYNIIHFFNHLPLDSSEFGPSWALAEALEVNITNKISEYENFHFGVVGDIKPISLAELKLKVEDVMTHDVRVWKNNDRIIKRIGIVSGSGKDLASLHDAHIHNCDAYITGEKSLTTLLYAKHIGLNFILGSHTFTELGGIINYAKKIKVVANIEIVKLKDEWIE